MSDIRELAEKRSRAIAEWQIIASRNCYGLDADAQVQLSAQSRMAQDAMSKADADYQAAIRGMSADELSVAAKA